MFLHELLKDAREVLPPLHQLVLVRPRLLHVLLAFRDVEAEPSDTLALICGRSSLSTVHVATGCKQKIKERMSLVTVAVDSTLSARGTHLIYYPLQGRTAPGRMSGPQDQARRERGAPTCQVRRTTFQETRYNQSCITLAQTASFVACPEAEEANYGGLPYRSYRSYKRTVVTRANCRETWACDG